MSGASGRKGGPRLCKPGAFTWAHLRPRWARGSRIRDPPLRSLEFWHPRGTERLPSAGAWPGAVAAPLRAEAGSRLELVGTPMATRQSREKGF